VREQLQAHRDHKNCKPCHNLIDPIGFALENCDWVGRWRDKEQNKAIDNKGVFPRGEAFAGPQQLRQALLARGIRNWDDCSIAQLSENLADNNYGALSLIQPLVASRPFRYRDLESGLSCQFGRSR
jgi:hypothetical protein